MRTNQISSLSFHADQRDTPILVLIVTIFCAMEIARWKKLHYCFLWRVAVSSSTNDSMTHAVWQRTKIYTCSLSALKLIQIMIRKALRKWHAEKRVYDAKVAKE